MPWPRPQVTPTILILEDPLYRVIQSSPILKLKFEIKVNIYKNKHVYTIMISKSNKRLLPVSITEF